MDRKSILHIPMSEYAHAISEERVIIRLRCAINDIKGCTLFYGDRACRQNPVIFTPVEMSLVASDLDFDYFEADFITLYKRICYYFSLDDGNEQLLYFGGLFSKHTVNERSEYFQLPFVHRADVARVPSWVNDAVIYNIFPDSFATKKEYISKKPTQAYHGGIPVNGKLGGTIKGIEENAEYLKELGVNCIYINPVFTAGEYHKYDIIDYYSIDPCFGTNKDFAQMVEALHSAGIRVIIDGVFNHSGWRFFAFEDLVVNGESSRYKNWYYNVSYPVIRPDNMEDIPGYECFAYERLMPKLNTENPEVIEYFCDVCRHWLREYNIDGWRLDVASEVDDGFWRAFKKAAHSVNPDALLIGEIWESAGHWLDGSMFNSTMNYDFRKHCREYFALGRLSSEEFASRITNMLMRYRKNHLPAQLNLLDSHDVSRFLSLCGESIDKMKLAVLFQMCFVGIPSVFYGDEQGISGMIEDEYRSPMTWERGDIFEFYKKAIKLRKDYKPLRHGSFKTLLANSGALFVFCREHENERLTVALNPSPLPAAYAGEGVNIIWQKGFDGAMLEPYGFCVSYHGAKRGA